MAVPRKAAIRCIRLPYFVEVAQSLGSRRSASYQANHSRNAEFRPESSIGHVTALNFDGRFTSMSGHNVAVRQTSEYEGLRFIL